MAQTRLLKIALDGVPAEHALTDDVTFASFTVNGGGPVLGATGLDMNNLDIVDVQDLAFNNPATATINQTAGNLIVDNIMAKERNNTMTTAGEILFPVVTDSAGQVDNFQIPQIAGPPTATPTNAGEGFMVYDTVNDDLYIWNGTNWDSQSIVEDANRLTNIYTAGSGGITANQVVYISAADTVDPAQADAVATSYAIGFAQLSAAAGNDVPVVNDGLLDGFTGLTPGARYYVDPATPGEITATLPVGAGNSIVPVGYAKSATELQIMIQTGTRRSL